MTLKTILAIAAISSFGLTACSAKIQSPPHEWAVKTQNDLRVAHDMMLESHPGPKDTKNPGFMKQADASYKNAMKIAANVTDQPGYAATLLAYTAGFRDGHFGVYATAQNTGSANFNWPGMLPSWRSDIVKIAHAEPEESAFMGAELVSCDGRKPKDLILENVFQFDSGKPDQDAYWARKAYNLFLDAENPLISRPENCTFKLTNGETKDHTLTWRKAPNEVFSKHRRTASFGARPAIGMAEIRPGDFWINLPDFSPNEEGVKQNRALFAEVISRREEMRNANSIVFDLRGNQGGSSAWGIEMVEALWGEDYPASLEAADDTYVEWRLSKENVEYLDWIANYLVENGHDELANDYFRPIHEGAKKAYADGQELYREPDFSEDEAETETTPQDNGPIANPVKTPVYVFTHGTCGSACLDFVDYALALDGVTHIGYPTSSDTNYMEIREVELPSGHAGMAIPTKVYRNRSRASGEFYEPIHRYDGFDWSDEAVKAWAQTITDK